MMMATKKKSAKKTVKKSVKKPGSKQKKKISAIPKGYHPITPYLILDDASKAIDFYKKIFGAKVIFRMDLPNYQFYYCRSCHKENGLRIH